MILLQGNRQTTGLVVDKPVVNQVRNLKMDLPG